ncbi:MAG: taurine dioxygenase [Verrucomicrobiales bacterium]|jgi:taurine dioxygenase
MTPLEIRPLEGAGAEVLGVDIATLTVGDWNQIEAAFAAFGAIFFRDQILTEQDHVDFARRWGSINVNRFFSAHPGYPEIALVVKEASDRTNIGSTWHADHSYDQEPALGSVLVARDLPASGGDTSFASMYAAFDALTSGTQKALEALWATHSARRVFGAQEQDAEYEGRLGNDDVADEMPDVHHPVVIRHPISGRKALYVNPTFTTGIDGMDENEGLALLNQLYSHCQSDEFVGRFEWEPGSVALWDNRAMWHFAHNDYAGQRRVMHRVTIDGCALQEAITPTKSDPTRTQRAGATLAGGIIAAAMLGIAEVIEPERVRQDIEIVSEAPEEEPLTELDFGSLPPLN